VSAASGHLPNLSGARRTLFVAGAVLLGAWAIYGLFRPGPFFRAYLAGYYFLLGFPLGAMALLMVQHLTGGMWGLALRPFLEAATRTLWVVAALFLPLLFGLGWLYPWRNRSEYESLGELEMVAKIDHYLNVPFFLVRSAIYFAVWLAFAFCLDRWSREQADRPSPELSRRFRLLSAPGLPACGLALTFASIDWFMSLEPAWFSPMYAVIVALGALLGALALGVAAAALMASRPPLNRVLNPSLFRDLGNLLLAFVMLFAYVAFSQFLIIWAGNLPENIVWYLRRFEGGWSTVALSLVVFQFVVPFLLLLSRRIKQDRRSLARVAILVLFMSYVNAVWIIVPAPAHYVSAWWDYWLVVSVPIGMSAIWLGAFLWQLDRRPLVLEHQLVGAEGLAHE